MKRHAQMLVLQPAQILVLESAPLDACEKVTSARLPTVPKIQEDREVAFDKAPGPLYILWADGSSLPHNRWLLCQSHEEKAAYRQEEHAEHSAAARGSSDCSCCGILTAPVVLPVIVCFDQKCCFVCSVVTRCRKDAHAEACGAGREGCHAPLFCLGELREVKRRATGLRRLAGREGFRADDGSSKRARGQDLRLQHTVKRTERAGERQTVRLRKTKARCRLHGSRLLVWKSNTTRAEPKQTERQASLNPQGLRGKICRADSGAAII